MASVLPIRRGRLDQDPGRSTSGYAGAGFVSSTGIGILVLFARISGAVAARLQVCVCHNCRTASKSSFDFVLTPCQVSNKKVLLLIVRVRDSEATLLHAPTGGPLWKCSIAVATFEHGARVRVRAQIDGCPRTFYNGSCISTCRMNASFYFRISGGTTSRAVVGESVQWTHLRVHFIHLVVAFVQLVQLQIQRHRVLQPLFERTIGTHSPCANSARCDM